MRMTHLRPSSLLFSIFCILMVIFILVPWSSVAQAESSIPQTDQTTLSPLVSPNPSVTDPRYISGFGADNAYTVFYEDRNDTAGCAYGSWIYFNQTTSGPLGFSSTSTRTDICDTHFVVKNWPITISGLGAYSYRGWGSVGNDPNHTFYVSNNLVNWTRIYYGAGMFSDPSNIMSGETIDYGFHDIVQINGNYIGFVESAGGHTYIAWSDNGDEHWTITGKVGGSAASDGPLNLSFTSDGPIPTGNFLLMMVNGQLVYGKLMVPGNHSGAFLAINKAAAQAATPVQAEAAFMNPANWTWSNGSTGLPASNNAVLLNTLSSGGHTIQEVFSVPTSNPQSDNVILFTAKYASGGFNYGLGCAASSSECLVVVPSNPSQSVSAAIEPTQTLLASAQLPIPVTGFAPGQVTHLQPRSSIKAYTGLNIRLYIPALQINQEIVGVPQANAQWDVSWLGNDIGYLYGSAFPTWNGNSVLTGHVYNSDGTPGIFINLDKMAWGDQINIQMAGQNYVFEVRKIKTVNASENSYVFKHETSPWLTLVTCKGFDESSGEYLYRTVVKAVLVKIQPVE